MKRKSIRDRFRRGIAIALAVVFACSNFNTATVFAEDGTFDVNPPVIESVEFTPSVESPTTNDSVTIRVTAYDAQTGVTSVGANVTYADEAGNLALDSQYVSLNKTGDKTYEGTVSLLNYRNAGTLCLRKLYVRDARENSADDSAFIYVDASQGETLANYKNKVSFTLGTMGTTEIKTTSVGIYKDWDVSEAIEGQTLSGTSVNFYTRMTVSDDTNVEQFYARFDGDNGTVIDDVNFYKVSEGYNGNGYVSSYKLKNGLSQETFRLSHIFAKMTDGSIVEVTPADGVSFANEWFNYQKPDYADESPAYESISLKVNGEEVTPEKMLYPGTVIDMTVTIQADKAYEDKMKAWFETVLEDNSSNTWIDLTRVSADSNVYTGQFEITNDTYPTVWRLFGMRWDSQNTTHGSINGYYFTVQQGEGGTVVMPTTDVSFYVSFLQGSDDGYIGRNSYNVDLKDVMLFSHITPEQLQLENAPASVGGMNIVDWHVYASEWNGTTSVTKDLGSLADYKVMPNQYGLRVSPVYDKKTVTVHYDSVKDGYLWREDVDYTYAQDEAITDDTIRSYLTREGQAEAGVAFEKWETDTTADDINRQLEFNHADVYVSACYVGKEVVDVEYDRGTLDTDIYDEVYLVDKGLSDEQLVEQYKNPKHNPYQGVDLNGAVKVKSWENDWIERGSWSYIRYVADFENCVAQFEIESDSTWESCYMGFDEGATFTLPSEMADYKDIVWDEMGSWIGSGKDTYKKIDGSETFTAVKLMYFHGIGVYVNGSSSGGSTNGGTASGSTGGTTTGGSAGETSAAYVPVTMPAEKISSEVNTITGAVKSGVKTVKIAMDGATVVPTAILEAAKGKDIDIVLDMGGYSWTINGKDIKAGNLKDIDLKVNFDTKVVPDSVVSAVAGSNPTKQISLAYNGDFGFKANLSFNIGNEYKGKYGNLFYYDSNGKLVFMNAGKISDDGTVSLEFSHASDYVIVISEENMTPAAPDTGDEAIPFASMTLLFAGAAFIFAVSKKKMSR